MDKKSRSHDIVSHSSEEAQRIFSGGENPLNDMNADAELREGSIDPFEGVANGPLKTYGLAKFCRISRVSQSRFLAVMCVSQSRFFSQSCLAVSFSLKAKKVVKHRVVYFFYKVK